MASAYDYQFDPQGESAAARVCRRVAGAGSSASVLELGTGPGAISRVLSDRYGIRATGVELNAEAAACAEPYLAEMIVGDLESEETWRQLAERRFDVVVLADVLEHLRTPGDLLQRLPKHLAPKGYLVISVPNVGHAGVLSALAGGEFPYAEKGLLDRTHIHLFTPRSLAQLLRTHGWVVSESEQVYVAPEDTEFAVHWRKLSPKQQALLNSFPEASTYQWIVVARHDPGALQSPDPDLLASIFAQGFIDQAARLENEIAALRGSRSWRLTAPLRRLASIFGGRKA